MEKKPSSPITVYILAPVVLIGLAALFLAARAAFSTIAGREQSIAAALLIEAGTVSEALAFARSRNRIAGAALIISFSVSLSYNVTQAHDARPDLVTWQLAAFGAGPLSALTFISLALGEELRIHAQHVAAWRAHHEHKADLRQRRQERRDRSLTGQAAIDRPVDRRWPDKTAFLSDNGRPHDLTAVELAKLTGVSERTARRWLAEARKRG